MTNFYVSVTVYVILDIYSADDSWSQGMLAEAKRSAFLNFWKQKIVKF